MENFHWLKISSRRFFRKLIKQAILHTFVYVSKNSIEMFLFQPWIIFQQLFFGPSISHTFNNKINCQACSFNNRFAEQYFRIGMNMITPVHCKNVFTKLIKEKCSTRMQNFKSH